MMVQNWSFTMVQSVKKKHQQKQLLGNKVGPTYPPHNAYMNVVNASV